MRFAGIDGLVVSGNTQRVSGGQPGVVLHRRLRSRRVAQPVRARQCDATRRALRGRARRSEGARRSSDATRPRRRPPRRRRRRRPAAARPSRPDPDRRCGRRRATATVGWLAFAIGLILLAVGRVAVRRPAPADQVAALTDERRRVVPGVDQAPPASGLCETTKPAGTFASASVSTLALQPGVPERSRPPRRAPGPRRWAR